MRSPKACQLLPPSTVLNCIFVFVFVFAGAKLYMAILRTGRTFYHLEIAQQQFYSQPRNSSQIAMRGQMGPKWGECYKCGGWWLDGWLMEQQEKFSWHLDAGSAGRGEQSDQILPTRSSTSVGARPPGGSQLCASLSPVDFSECQVCNEQHLHFS